MPAAQRNDAQVVVHWPSGSVLQGAAGGSLGQLPFGAPVGDLRSYLRDLALGRR